MHSYVIQLLLSCHCRQASLWKLEHTIFRKEDCEGGEEEDLYAGSMEALQAVNAMLHPPPSQPDTSTLPSEASTAAPVMPFNSGDDQDPGSSTCLGQREDSRTHMMYLTPRQPSHPLLCCIS